MTRDGRSIPPDQISGRQLVGGVRCLPPRSRHHHRLVRRGERLWKIAKQAELAMRAVWQGQNTAACRSPLTKRKQP
jgi:hypothetical protein